MTYLYADHLGTPRIGTDATKAITWRYQSDAFGVGTPSGTASVRLRLPGQIDLGILGIGYNYYRDYDPQVGRYLESDPIGLAGGVNAYGYALQNPLSHSDVFGLDVLQQSHPVALGQNHAKLLLVPINQDRWRGDPRFNNVLPDGRRYAALGAGPEDGYLVSNFNRERDIQLDHNVSSEACPVPDRYGSEDQLIEALLAIDKAYGDRADYEWFPSRFSDGYNSNSYISGLLRAAGVDMPAPPSTPGYDKPLPMESAR
ncbi:MAG: hypothetical protein HONDAALG_03474 [Gammaproteobacteria bacterium]|nr:hypothetical protein [Gammaproteobacteria bacterium]